MGEADLAEGITRGLTEEARKIVADNKVEIFSWLNKQKIHHLPIDFNVGVSITYQKGQQSQNFFLQMLKNLKQVIDLQGLSKQIKIQDISNIPFKVVKEAEEFRTKKNLDLLIWGEFTQDGLKIEGREVSKINLNFTFSHPDNAEKQI